MMSFTAYKNLLCPAAPMFSHSAECLSTLCSVQCHHKEKLQFDQNSYSELLSYAISASKSQFVYGNSWQPINLKLHSTVVLVSFSENEIVVIVADHCQDDAQTCPSNTNIIQSQINAK